MTELFKPSPPTHASSRRTKLMQDDNSNERGFRIRGLVDDEWGRSESIDPDNVGDIADEGIAHRG
jgi:hypothetical protein